MPAWLARATAHPHAIPAADSQKNAQHVCKRGARGPEAAGRPGVRWDFPSDTSDWPPLGCHATSSAVGSRGTARANDAARIFGPEGDAETKYKYGPALGGIRVSNTKIRSILFRISFRIKMHEVLHFYKLGIYFKFMRQKIITLITKLGPLNCWCRLYNRGNTAFNIYLLVKN